MTAVASRRITMVRFCDVEHICILRLNYRYLGNICNRNTNVIDLRIKSKSFAFSSIVACLFMDCFFVLIVVTASLFSFFFA